MSNDGRRELARHIKWEARQRRNNYGPSPIEKILPLPKEIENKKVRLIIEEISE